MNNVIVNAKKKIPGFYQCERVARDILNVYTEMIG